MLIAKSVQGAACLLFGLLVFIELNVLRMCDAIHAMYDLERYV